MSKTLQDILIDSSSYLDLSPDVPTGDELVVRSNYADRAIREATAAGQMKEMKKVYVTNTSTLSTISLPADFREFQAMPNILNSNGGWQEYEEINPEDQYVKDTSDYYCYTMGTRASGKYLYINNVIANATLSFTYQAYPSGLLTLSAICELSDENYVTARVESLVLESRQDDRFTIKQAEAERRLANMIGRGNKPVGGGINRTRKNFKNPLA